MSSQGDSLRIPSRRWTAWIVVAASFLVLLLPASISASTTEVCSQVNSTFCVTAGLTATSNPAGLIAAAPVSLDFSVSNSSTSSDQAYWLHSATLTLASNGIASPPTLTPSDQLPNGLLLAGGGTCTGPDFTDCPGGHGSVVAIADVLGSDFPASGTFGIKKIVNLNPAGAGDYGDYDVTIDARLCPPNPYPCFNNVTVEEVTIAQPPAGAPAPAPFPITTEGSSAFTGGTVYYALNSFSFHVDGQSNQLDGGSAAGQTYTILALPIDCGTASGSSSFTSHGSLTVAVPESITVTGCPTAVLPSPTISGHSANFDGSGSSTSVAGRTIAHWDWTFGDGTHAVTAVPTVSHAYAPGSTHTASLVVEDSAGARSSSVSVSAKVPASCTVPKLERKTLRAAKKLIENAHCALGTVKKAFSNSIPKGEVISQRPAPGKVEPQGARVSLTVSNGKR